MIKATFPVHYVDWAEYLAHFAWHEQKKKMNSTANEKPNIKRWEKFKDKKKTKQDERYIYSSSFSLLSLSQYTHMHGFWPLKSTHCIRANAYAELNGRIVQKIETKGSTDKKIHVKTAMDDTIIIRRKKTTKYTQNKASRERKQTKHFVSWLEQRAHISCKLSFAIFTVARERVRVLLFALALTWIRCVCWSAKRHSMHNMIILRIQQQSARNSDASSDFFDTLQNDYW